MRKSTKKKLLENVAFGVCLGLLIWGFLSFIDVNMHNMSDYDYASWNIFNFIDLL